MHHRFPGWFGARRGAKNTIVVSPLDIFPRFIYSRLLSEGWLKIFAVSIGIFATGAAVFVENISFNTQEAKIG